MGDISGFNANNESSDRPNSIIPAGDYQAVLISSTKKQTKAGDGAYLAWDFQILQGEFKNSHVFTNLNIWNKNEKAVQIAKADLSAMCKATGILTPNDSSELCNIPVVITVKVKGDQNEISGYKPRHAGPPNTTVQPQQPPSIQPGNSQLAQNPFGV